MLTCTMPLACTSSIHSWFAAAHGGITSSYHSGEFVQLKMHLCRRVAEDQSRLVLIAAADGILATCRCCVMPMCLRPADDVL